ncbi:ATP-binding cassette domain-containing protein [Paenibacillus periandrae]|uniref:ATP-binding cassette domain-containing protein n=1 Tax=Paenibacillus periandrae TaxID=1761741 RepID=UPI001F08BA24|nr:ATP-binding cassette domain-containing protein [Paenibacillus periandrae]
MSDDLVIRELASFTTNGNRLSKPLNHQFHAGTLTLVLGRSGTGKTMLLEMLSGLREPSSGQISLGSTSLWTGTSKRRKPNRQVLLRLGTAFQHPEQQLFANTIKEEFQYTLRPFKLSPAESNQRIQHALRLFSGEPESWLERDPFQLSGGQQRRLSLALLQAAAPDWLLLDEPTAGIDAEGASLLYGHLQQRKAEGLGTIIVTHDPEALLTLADSVLILYDDTFWQGSPSELADQKSIWSQVGLAPPVQLNTLNLLQASGIPMPIASWPDAKAAATAIKSALTVHMAAGAIENLEEHTRMDTTSAEESYPINGPKAEQVKMRSQGTSECMTGAAPEPITESTPRPIPAGDDTSYSMPTKKSGLKAYDPRAVWVAYMLISPGILVQSHWFGWIAAFIVTLAVIRYAHIPLMECLKPAAGLIVFTLIASVLSGLAVEGAEAPLPGSESETGGILYSLPFNLRFAVSPAVETFFRLSILVLIMLIGFVLLSGINHLRLKRGLEQGLHWLKRIRVPVDPFALTASLIIRFIPMIIDEWQRFAKIAAARGKYPFRPGQIPIFRMRMTMIPVLISLLRLGEALSLILIVRGVGRADSKPTIAFRLRFNRYDYRLVAAAASILMVLLVLNYIILA